MQAWTKSADLIALWPATGRPDTDSSTGVSSVFMMDTSRFPVHHHHQVDPMTGSIAAVSGGGPSEREEKHEATLTMIGT